MTNRLIIFLVFYSLVLMYEKQGDLWVNTTYTKEDTHISLPQLDIMLAIADLYEWVKFDN
jgi:hypothetical protein